ncbi:hypothetical protein EMIHUDRAFT_218168 [Emiliania huxleyi CCMP1516]|uniref:Secreted protein n=2 Tax=Emiliania huxleyi TaxID=2903 RepID=A0A0D3I8T1_EMIH1|nr:hypothetical protein EMIHUDRAFT_218168 [Emiliania huxleyi CCMP1516]EOD07666.1 hypothetical protein EMIHUDRAFT_218168 [Emiliania huxleyi CCMP1516]|eukprot:XP_005760095.1 hypothetical protein EMIHUDRAFT_218168 [Emiliania huxleyi CCMP1516]
MPPAVLLVINLRIRAAADCCCGSSSSLLLPDSVKPAVQRGVQNSRGFVPPEAERIRAHRPELDGTPRLTETRGTGHGRTTEREVASERQNNEKNTDLTMSSSVKSWRAMSTAASCIIVSSSPVAGSSGSDRTAPPPSI